jgi:protein-S-isoprenylcysteine O-methyltransferase Ste14
MKDWRGTVLFGAQILCMVYLLLTGYWLASPHWIGLEILGGGLAAWAVAAMKLRHLNPLPAPRPDARLVTRGPYRWIRHPMYAAVLIMMLALVLDQPTPARLIVWLVLLVTLLTKMNYEETLLARRFPEYAAYRKRTKRLIPFVY